LVDQPIEENSNLSSLNSNLSAFDSLDPDLQALVGDLAKRIYGGEEITFDSDLLHHTAKPLVDGLQKGYGKSLVEVEYNSPDYKALENLTKNAFKFSASKDFHILQDMTNALRDGDRVRSFDEFRAEVDNINVKYNQNWLRTEYNQAIAASQATARWQEFQENAKAMPFLQYQAVMDSNTRPDHQRLHGVIKRIDNPFWNTHFPPLGWGCRCEVIQLPGKNHKETPDGSFQKPDVPPQFRENFGKKQQLFSDKHPYYQNKCQGCTKTAKLATENNLQCQACLNGAKECANYIHEVRDKKESKKEWDNIDTQIWNKEQYYPETGGFSVSHHKKAIDNLSDPTGGTQGEIEVVKLLAQKGKKIYRLPDNVIDDTIPILGTPYYKLLKFNPKDNKWYGYPDLYLDGYTWDVKTTKSTKISSIREHIRDGRKADKVIFNLKESCTLDLLIKAIGLEVKFRDQRNELKSLPDMYVIDNNGELTCLFKKNGHSE